MGQERTLAALDFMSALPPITDIVTGPPVRSVLALHELRGIKGDPHLFDLAVHEMEYRVTG